MIYGCIPVGGNGSRLGLPFSKEMLPLIGFDFYKPISMHVVEKMKLAGCQTIFFVHGTEYKKDILNFYSDSSFVHLTQRENSPFVLNDILKILNSGTLLYGLPDTVFEGNPFIESIKIQGNVSCIFYTNNNNLKVDRINNNNKFDIKSAKTKKNKNLFWGAVKFEIKSMLLNYNGNEVGEYLNLLNTSYLNCGKYMDIGTWKGYQTYCKNYKKFK